MPLWAQTVLAVGLVVVVFAGAITAAEWLVNRTSGIDYYR